MYTLPYKYIEVSSEAIFSDKGRVIYTSIEVRALVVLAILYRSYYYLFLFTLLIRLYTANSTTTRVRTRYNKRRYSTSSGTTSTSISLPTTAAAARIPSVVYNRRRRYYTTWSNARRSTRRISNRSYSYCFI